MSGKQIYWTISLIALIQCSLSTPTVPKQEDVSVQKVSVPGYRLPDDFTPVSYEIELSNIDLESIVFTGKTSIVIISTVDTDTLMLHGKDLSYLTNSVTIECLNTTEVFVKVIEEDTTYEILTITVSPIFRAGNVYRISFNQYNGSMNRDMLGFYVSKYTNASGDTVLLGTTMLHPTFARTIFPCFDEPKFKATFRLSIQRPPGFQPSISNMKIDPNADNSNNWDRFYKTPIMSTYLLAFIVSDFVPLETTSGEANDDEFRIIGRPNAQGQGEYAFVEGKKLLNAIDEWMNIPYYSIGNNKLDHAAIPDFSAGAMENWGLIDYREAYLLADYNQTSVKSKQKISSILAHEMSHMWFGDYVTYHWWSDTWLNEGFARLFEYKVPDMVETTMYNTMTQFPVQQVQTALLADTTIRSTPLTYEKVNTLDEIQAHFGTISYNKGASVIRMIAAWVGEDNFQKSINEYMIIHAYGMATPNDLYESLQANAQTGQNVADVMSSWVSQSGYPILDVTINYEVGTMDILQRRAKKAWETQQDTLYQIPITYATKSSANFEDTSANLLMTTETATVSIPITGEEWIVLNKQQIGFYRVNYDYHSWTILRTALLGEDRKIIHSLNRGQIVDDVFNLAREEVLSYSTTLSILDFLEYEDEYAPWQSAFTGFTFIRQQLHSNEDLLARLDGHILKLLNTVTTTLGFTDEGDYLTQIFRLNTMNFACALGHGGCVEYATKTFNAYISDNTIVPANHREYVYCQGVRQGGPDAFDKLWDKFLTENLFSEQIIIITALGCTTSEEKINFLLDEIIKSIIRKQDVNTTINGIIDGNLDNAEIVLAYLENATNFVNLKSKLESYSTLFKNLVPKLAGHQIGRFNQLIEDHKDDLLKSELVAASTAFSELAQQGTYLLKAGKEIEAWLNLKYRM